MSLTDNVVTWLQGLKKHIDSSPHLAPLQGFYTGDACSSTDHTSFIGVHQQVIWHICSTLNTQYLDLMVRAIDEYIHGPLGVPPSDLDDGPVVRDALDHMRDTGHTYLPPVDPEWTARMMDYFESQPVHPWAYAKDATQCTLKDARKGKFASYFLDQVFACPHLLDIANDATVLSVVEGYLGTVPTILGMSAWWSFADPAGATEAQLFHLDVDDLRFCKMFIYLTDVDEDNGPFTYMEGTHVLEYLGDIRRQWPGGVDEFDKWYFRTLRKTDGQIKRVFGYDPVQITGPAGTLFMANTFGAHKGMPPKTGERLACQVLYGISPMFQEQFEALIMGGPGTGHVHEAAITPPLDYVNRHFMQPAAA